MQDAATSGATSPNRSDRGANWRVEPWLVAALLVLGFFVGSTALSSFLRAGWQSKFHQTEYSPAVAIACGLGYVRLQVDEIPALRDFLTEQRPSFSCNELPSSPAIEGLTAFDAISRYLQVAAGVVWRVRGISWRALDAPLCLGYAIVGVLAYGLLRLGFGPLLSLAGALAIILSPVNMWNLPHLRDYSKAPFVLALLWLSGLLVVKRREPSTRLALSAAAGLVLGLGLGFRNDLLVAIPPLVVTIGALCPIEPRRRIRSRGLALACFLAGFVVAGYPILKAYSRVSNTPHVVLLGLMSPFDDALGIEPSLYEFGYAYNDPFAAFLVRGVVERERPVGDFGAGVPGYDAAAMDYLGRIALIFPADIAVRAYASALRVFQTPFLGEGYAPTWLQAPVYHAARLRLGLTRRAGWLVWIGVLAGFTTVLARTPRLGLWLLMSALWFGGAGAVQYQRRHVFHLEVLNIAALLAGVAVLVWAGREIARRASDRQPPGHRWWRPMVGPVVAGLLVISTAAAVLLTLRLVQTARVRALLTAYQAAPTVRWQGAVTPLPEGLVRVETPGPPAGKWPRAMSLLAVDFGGPSCHDMVSAGFRYVADDPYFDYSRSVRVPVNAHTLTRVIMPVFDYPPKGVRFSGLELSANAHACLADVRRIVDDSQLTVPLFVVLPDGWQRQTLYQRLRWSR